MTPEQQQQLAALRERLNSDIGDVRLTYAECASLLQMVEDADRLAHAAEFAATIHRENERTAHERAATAERERIVAWLRKQADNGEKYLDDNALDRNVHPSTVSSISTMRTVAGSIELGLYKGGGDGCDRDSDGFDKQAHDIHCPEHSGINGHYCPEWDYLWICQDCEMEYSCCTCFHEKSLEEVL